MTTTQTPDEITIKGTIYTVDSCKPVPVEGTIWTHTIMCHKTHGSKGHVVFAKINEAGKVVNHSEPVRTGFIG